MRISLTKDQQTTLKSMVDISCRLADQLLYIMRNSGIDKIPGAGIRIDVYPEYDFTTEDIKFGMFGKESGYIELAKGVHDEEFKPTGRDNSTEYELLFADEETRKIMQEILRKAKPLPPDGLWVSTYDDPPVMDCGVSVSDSVAQ